MKRINVITKYFLPVEGGIEKSIDKTYSRFSKKGYKVTVHTSKDSYERKGVFKDFEKINKLDVFRYKSGVLGFFPPLTIFKSDILVLHNFNLFPHSIILLISSFLKTVDRKNFVLIITPHGGMTPNYANLSFKETIIKKIANRLLIKLFVNYACDSIRAVSLWERKKLLEVGVNNSLIKIIPDGIEDEAFLNKYKIGKKIKLFADKLKPYIIQIGKIYPTKKYETTIRALQNLDKEIHLLIIGRSADSKYKFELVKIVGELELTKRVHFVEHVGIQEKYYLLKRAFSFVLTSEWESFGRIFYEAISQGLPVAVSDKTGPLMHIGNDIFGFKFDNDNPSELAEIISKIKHLPKNKLKTIRKKNSEFSKGYSWNEVSRLLVEHLSSLGK